jgi:hypothetical protein
MLIHVRSHLLGDDRIPFLQVGGLYQADVGHMRQLVLEKFTLLAKNEILRWRHWVPLAWIIVSRADVRRVKRCDNVHGGDIGR